jgi:hypothetical protein
MAEPVIPPKAKLFIGILTNSDEFYLPAEKALIKKFGEIDYKTTRIRFTHTDYYSSMGPNLFKAFISFDTLIRRESIADIKLYTNRLENKISGRSGRRVNIDPGYLTLSNVYLATCKDYFHRAYLAKGIYIENEYRYVAKHYQPWEWTYPDYKKSEDLHFFHYIRRLYNNQIKGR